MSATCLLSCHRSGASLTFLFRSSICSKPLAEYLQRESAFSPGRTTSMPTILGLWHSIPHKCRCRVCQRDRYLACLSKDRAAVQQTQYLRRSLDNRPCFYFVSDDGAGQRRGIYDRTLWPSIDRFCNHTSTTEHSNIQNEANLVACAYYTEQWFLLVCLGRKV